jgi:RNA polymerase sigma factor (TIGR02999 family)
VPAEITVLLKAWSGGDQSALNQLTTLVYRELHRMARRYMKDERAANTLQATVLINEVYLRLVDVQKIEWQHRAQFFGLAAQLMRRILIDAARTRGAAKRGGGVFRVDIDEAPLLAPEPNDFVVALDDALESLARLAPRQARVVELRYFGGLSEEETAEVLQSSCRTVRRDWQFARAWLMNELSSRPL